MAPPVRQPLQVKFPHSCKTNRFVLFIGFHLNTKEKLNYFKTFMDKNFFNKTRILDGGMGQELLHRGLKPKVHYGLLKH